MEQLEGIANFLQTFGGWGVAVVFLVGIIYLYRSSNALLEKRNQQIVEVLKETTAMLQQNADAMHRTERLCSRVEHLLDNLGKK